MASCTLQRVLYEQRGLYFALLSGFLFASQGLGTHLLAAEYVSPWFICFAYNILHTLAIPLVDWHGTEHFTIKETTILFAAGLFDTCNFTFALLAYSYTTIGNASAILLSKPLWCALLAAIFLKERFSCLDAILIVLNLIGVVFISKPPIIFKSTAVESDNTAFIGSLCALTGAVSGGGQFVSIRCLTSRRVFDRFLLFLVKCTIGFPCFVIMVCVHYTGYKTIRTSQEWSYMGLACFSGISASLTTYLALESRDAKTVSLLATVQVIVAYVLQSFIVPSKLDLLTIVGASFITLSPVFYILKSMIKENFTNDSDSTEERESIGG